MYTSLTTACFSHCLNSSEFIIFIISMIMFLSIKQSIAVWFEDNRVDVMNRPAQSPNLNPIEHLWDELERQLRARS